MPKRGNKFIMFASLFLTIFFLYNTKLNPRDKANTIVATINDKKITFSQLKDFSVNTYGVHLEDRNKEILDCILDQEVLLYYAHEIGIVEDILQDQFDKQMLYSRERIMLELFFDLEAKNNVKVENKDIIEFYDNQPIFTLKGLQFPFTEEQALQKSISASKELNRGNHFDTVYKMFFPDKKSAAKGVVGIVNFFDLPDYLRPYSFQLTQYGNASDPIETEFGYTVFYRDTKPPLNKSKGYIHKELERYKTEEFIQNRYAEISSNMRDNLYAIDRSYTQRNDIITNEILASNRLTNDFLTESELYQRLIDLYDYDSFINITQKDLLEYINLFLSQKVILTLAKENKYFENPKFTSQWEMERVRLLENQNQEIVDYMIEDFYDLYVKNISDDLLQIFYQKNADLYRKSDFFKLQTIITNNRTAANKAYQEAKTNSDFDAIVVQYSNDPLARFSKGIGSYKDSSELEKVYDVLLKHKVGEVLKPMEIDVGVYHVYKILDRVQGALRPLDEVKAQVTTKAIFELMQDYIAEIIKRYNITITIYEDNLIPQEKDKNEKLYERYFGTKNIVNKGKY